MKKNKMLRIASVLLVAVMMSTCAISGTFAKYVTSGDAEDSARVAKWGVTIETSSDLFDEVYARTSTEDKHKTITNTVVVDTAGTNLVAPGTTKSINFSISGSPEVAVEVNFAFTATSDVKIPEGTTVATGVTLDKDYTPVVFTLKKNGTVLETGTLSDIATKFNSLSAVYGPNSTALAGSYTLTWVWDFEGANTINAADTYLGNVAAGTKTDANTNTVIDFDFTITVTQID